MPENRNIRVCEAANTPAGCSSEKTVLRQQDGEASPRQVLLEVKNLEVTYGSGRKAFKALNRANFEIYKGETFGLVGESGSGKSVFTKSFMGLLDANGSITSGTIDYYGADDGKPIRLSDLKKEKDWLKVRGHEIAMIMQDPMTSLNPLKTIGDQILEAVNLHQGLKGTEARARTLEYLRDVGISDPEVRFKQYPHEFSGGMRQRVVIAIAAACRPQILICDEPTTALDVTIQAQMLGLINELQKRLNTAMILITHDLGVVAQTCEKVMVMYAGEAIEYGTAEDIFETTQRHPYTQGLFNAIPKLDENTKRLEAIEGMMADPTQKIEGCRFADRCKYATAACKKAQKMREVTPGHFIRCCRFDPPQSNT